MSNCYQNQNYLCCLINRKVIIHTGCQRYCVVICEVCDCYIKAIDVKCGNVKFFNFDRIDFIEEVC